MVVAFITGINGQDGSYLAELLLSKNYTVYGIVRRSSSFNTQRIEHIRSQLHLSFGDVTDSTSMYKVITHIIHDHPLDNLEIYHLGAQSHVRVSFDIPEYTFEVDGKGTLILLEIIKNLSDHSHIKIYQASSSELYGKVLQIPQNELTPFNPQSPYAIAKLYAFWIAKNYRDAYHLFASNGILFNHESPRRGGTFVTQKIIQGLKKIKAGDDSSFILSLGNLEAKRDWGHAKDYVYGMWLILQQDHPDDFVLATGQQFSVRQFVQIVASKLHIQLQWKGIGGDEIGIDSHTGKTIINIDPKYFRPTEVQSLLGDPSKAQRILHWKPTYNLDQLIDDMIKS